MAKSSATLLRAVLTVAILLGIRAEEEEDDNEEETDDEEEDEDEDEEELISPLVWGLTIFLIFTFLVLVTVGFERAQEVMLEASTQQMRPVVKQMFSELTILGFLSITTLILSQSGALEAISEEVFGESEESKELLTELLETVHYILFLVMVVFIIEVMLLVRLGNGLMRRWSTMNDWAMKLDEAEKVREDESAIESRVAAAVASNTTSTRHWAVVAAMESWSRDFTGHRDKMHERCLGKAGDAMARSSTGEELDFGLHEGLVFWGMRREFLKDRSPLPPHSPSAKPLPEHFDYAKYLTEALSEDLTEMVDVSWSTWAFLLFLAAVWCSFIAGFYDEVLIFSKLWIGSEYLLLLGLFRFYKHTLWIQQALVCPTSASAARDWKAAWSAAVATGEHPLTVACDSSGGASPRSLSNRKRGNSGGALSRPLMAGDATSGGGGGGGGGGAGGVDQLPMWACRPPKVVLTKPRPKILQMLLGKAPNKQHMLFTFQENGHASHVFACRLILLIQALYISVLCVVLLPATANFKHCYEHCNHEQKVEQTVQLVTHTVAAILPLFGFLLLAKRAIPQAIHVSSVGTFRSTRLVHMVIREQKAARAVQVLETLHGMRRQILAAKKIKEQSSRPATQQRRLSQAEREERQQEQALLLESLPKEQMEALSRTFDLYDSDSSGTLDQAELAGLMSSLGQSMSVEEGGSTALLLGLDTNHDGSVDKMEFMAWQAKAQKGTNEKDINEMAKDLFEMFDEDGSGSITITEFQEGLKRFHIEMTPDEMTILVNELDQDNSGDVGLEEFVELLKKNTIIDT